MVKCTKPKFFFGALTKVGWVWMIITTVFGIATTVVLKAMNLYEKTPGCLDCKPTKFNHPYMQTAMLFFGEFMCIIYYTIVPRRCFMKHKQSAKYEDFAHQKLTKKKARWFHFIAFAIPALCDLWSSVFSNIALALTSTSAHTMIRNGNILFVALMSFGFKDYRKFFFDLPQLIGLVFIMGGLTMTGSASLWSEDERQAPNPLLGAFLLIFSDFFQATVFVSEEIFVRNIDVEASLAVCIEGAWGLVFSGVMLPFLKPIQDKNELLGDDPSSWIYQLKNNWQLVVLQVSFILVLLVFRLSGFETTKHASASVRTTFGGIRPFITWGVSLSMQWEYFHIPISFLELAGYLVSVAGVFIYNNVWVLIPYLRETNAKKFQSVDLKRTQKVKDEALVIEAVEDQ